MLRKLYIKIETEVFSIFLCKINKNKLEIEMERYYPLESKEKENNYAINEVCYEICDKIRLIEEKYKIKNIVGIIQTEKNMLREVELLKRSSQKDLEAVLNIDMKKFGNFNLKDNIIIKRKSSVSEGEFAKEKVEIFPRVYVDLFKKIEAISKIKCSGIYTDYSLIENLWKKEVNSNIDYIIEFRKKDLLYSRMGKDGLEESIVVRNDAVDKDFINHIRKQKSALILDYDNIKCEILENSLREPILIEKEKLLEIELGKNKLHNFLEDNYFSELYKKIIIFLSIVLLFTVFLSVRYAFSNKVLESQLEKANYERVIKNKKIDKKAVKGFGNIYGVNIEELVSEIEKSRSSVISLTADENNMEIEFLLPSRKEVSEILDLDINKNAEIEYIKTDIVSREEAENTYGIGVENEKSNKETGKEKNNQENTKEEINQDNKGKAFKEGNKKEANKIWENSEKQKSNKSKRWQKNNNKENSKICSWKEKGKENKKDKINFRIYAEDISEESISDEENLSTEIKENDNKKEDETLGRKFEKNSKESKKEDNTQDKSQEDKSDSKMEVGKNAKKEVENKKENADKKIKLYFLKIKIKT